jgi:hypothetical protein
VYKASGHSLFQRRLTIEDNRYSYSGSTRRVEGGHRTPKQRPTRRHACRTRRTPLPKLRCEGSCGQSSSGVHDIGEALEECGPAFGAVDCARRPGLTELHSSSSLGPKLLRVGCKYYALFLSSDDGTMLSFCVKTTHFTLQSAQLAQRLTIGQSLMNGMKLTR